MKTLIKNTALITICLAIGIEMGKRAKKTNITITDKDDKLLADISEKDVIFHDDVHVYMNGTKLT